MMMMPLSLDKSFEKKRIYSSTLDTLYKKSRNNDILKQTQSFG
jgi:hypothetical protein